LWQVVDLDQKLKISIGEMYNFRVDSNGFDKASHPTTSDLAQIWCGGAFWVPNIPHQRILAGKFFSLIYSVFQLFATFTTFGALLYLNFWRGLLELTQTSQMLVPEGKGSEELENHHHISIGVDHHHVSSLSLINFKFLQCFTNFSLTKMVQKFRKRQIHFLDVKSAGFRMPFSEFW
jgi:hypothetical protein